MEEKVVRYYNIYVNAVRTEIAKGSPFYAVSGYDVEDTSPKWFSGEPVDAIYLGKLDLKCESENAVTTEELIAMQNIINALVTKYGEDGINEERFIKALQKAFAHINIKRVLISKDAIAKKYRVSISPVSKAVVHEEAERSPVCTVYETDKEILSVISQLEL